MAQQYIGTGRLGVAQSVAYTGTAGQVTNGITSGVNKVRVIVTTDAMVTTDGTTPAVSPANGAYVPALSAEYFTVTPGQKVRAVQVSAAGTLFTVELE